jgi:hypothetical protein
MHFRRVTLDRAGKHYTNTSGWPGAGISCLYAANVSFEDVRGTELKIPGYIERCLTCE